MTSSVVTPARLVAVSFTGCTLLWLSIVWGGSVNDGYTHGRDFVSALSSRGGTHAWIGMTGLAGFAVAHLAAGLRVADRSKVAAALLMCAGASGLVVSVARINCPLGAGNCLDDGVPDDLLDQVHGIAVASYEVFFASSIVAAVAALYLRRRDDRSWAAMVSLGVLGAASVATVLSIPDANPGLMQRVWLGVNTVGVLSLALINRAFDGSQGAALTRGSGVAGPAPAGTGGALARSAGRRGVRRLLSGRRR